MTSQPTTYPFANAPSSMAVYPYITPQLQRSMPPASSPGLVACIKKLSEAILLDENRIPDTIQFLLVWTLLLLAYEACLSRELNLFSLSLTMTAIMTVHW